MKTIFGKMFWTNVLVLIIAFVVIGTLMFGFLGSYMVEQKSQDLFFCADMISDATIETQVTNPNFNNTIVYQKSIEWFSAFSQCYIAVINENQEIVTTSLNMSDLDKVPSSLTTHLLSGIRINQLDTFEGFFKQSVLTVGVPIKLNNKIIGGVYVCTPFPQLDRARYEITFLFIICAIITAILSFFVVFLTSQKMSAPLNQMSRMAKQITKGEFNSQVLVETDDEIGELAKSLNSMSKSLSKLEEMRSSFIANVSHELRTPITTISGFLEGILDGTIPPDMQSKYLSIVLEEAKRLSKLVSDMLVVSKMNYKKNDNEIEMIPFDINELIRLIIIKFEKSIDEKHLEVCALLSNDPFLVKGEKDSIYRVVTNLMDNAIKFSDAGRKLIVEVSTQLDKYDKINVSIYNEGMGINKDEIEYIWERFYKTDKSRSKDKKGVGLGLYIVKSIISSHNEKIWAESDVVEGDTVRYVKFTFTLAKAD